MACLPVGDGADSDAEAGGGAGGGVGGEAGGGPDTCCEIVSDPPVGDWQEGFEPEVACTCTGDDTGCNSLWIGRVDALDGNRATLTVHGTNGAGPSVDVAYWVVESGQSVTSCLNRDLYAARVQGLWVANTDLRVEVDVWPTDEACARAGDGSVVRLAVISGGRDVEHQRTWFQKVPFEFTRAACP